MTSRFSSLLCAAALAAASSLAGCKAKLTYVHVTVAPAPGEPAGIRKIDLQLTLAGKSATKTLGDGSKDLQLPADVTFEIGSGAGQMAITAIATDAAGNEVDRGTSTVEVVSGAVGSTTVQLAGGKAALASTTTTNDFGSQPVGTSTGPATFTFRNTGAKATGTLSVAIAGVGSQHFVKGTDGCNGTSLQPADSCNVVVLFHPTTLNALAATLTATASPGGSATVSLTGVGAPNPQTLTVTRAGNGVGSLLINNTNPPCTAATCSPSFAYGTSVTVAPTPASGSHFTGWTGDCSGTGSCTVVMNQAQSVTANFSAITFLLSAATSGSVGSGTVASNPPGINNCGAGGTCTAAFNNNSTVVLTATQGLNFIFNGWSSNCGPSSGTCSVLMSQAQSVTANFVPSTFVVTVTRPTASGAVVFSSPAGINCNSSTGSTCSASFVTNSSVTLSVSTNSSVSFTGWGNDDCASAGTSTNCTLPITAARTATASFTQLYQLTVSTGGAGRGTITTSDSSLTCSSGTCSAMYPPGTTVTLIGTAAPGSSPIAWSACQGSAPCAVTIGAAAQTVSTTFGCSYNYIVDPSVGLDTNPGSCQQPFLTIGKGLKTASRGQNVFVAPGTYDSTRETFPLTVPDGVFLFGDVSGKGASTKLVGYGVSSYSANDLETVHVVGSAQMSGFTVTCNNVNATCKGTIVTSNATFSNNTFAGSTNYGAFVPGGSPSFVGNTFSGNYTGLAFLGSAVNGKVQGNNIQSNTVGVELDIAGADLGGGQFSTGGNTFACNTAIDVYVGSGSITANNNTWDHVPPTVGTGQGSDLFKGTGVTVTTAGAQATGAVCF